MFTFLGYFRKVFGFFCSSGVQNYRVINFVVNSELITMLVGLGIVLCTILYFVMFYLVFTVCGRQALHVLQLLMLCILITCRLIHFYIFFFYLQHEHKESVCSFNQLHIESSRFFLSMLLFILGIRRYLRNGRGKNLPGFISISLLNAP